MVNLKARDGPLHGPHRLMSIAASWCYLLLRELVRFSNIINAATLFLGLLEKDNSG